MNLTYTLISIPRYILLLQDLLKHTPPEHVDYENLKEAMATTKKVADAINEGKRDIENKKKMLAIQESFGTSLVEVKLKVIFISKIILFLQT